MSKKNPNFMEIRCSKGHVFYEDDHAIKRLIMNRALLCPICNRHMSVIRPWKSNCAVVYEEEENL